MSAAAAVPIQLQPALHKLPHVLQPGIAVGGAEQKQFHDAASMTPTAVRNDSLQPENVAVQSILDAPSDDMSDPPPLAMDGEAGGPIPIRYSWTPSSDAEMYAEGFEDDNDEEEDETNYSSSSSIPEDNIQFDRVYALHNFLATVPGQATVDRGCPLVLLDDSNSYWYVLVGHHCELSDQC